jgi:hypothetical protein
MSTIVQSQAGRAVLGAAVFQVLIGVLGEFHLVGAQQLGGRRLADMRIFLGHEIFIVLQ